MKRNLFLMLMLSFGAVQASGNENVVGIDPHATVEIIDVVSVDGSQPNSRLSSFQKPHEGLENQDNEEGLRRAPGLQITQSRSMTVEEFEELRAREEALNAQQSDKKPTN